MFIAALNFRTYGKNIVINLNQPKVMNENTKSYCILEAVSSFSTYWVYVGF